MPEKETEVFSNPLPPPMKEEVDDDAHPLTNEDFRKLLMTPRAPSTSGAPMPASSAIRSALPLTKTYEEEEDDPAVRRRKKKSYYAKLKKMEEDRQKELAEKYRDRAQERREGSNKDYDQTDIISTTADYRAVAPDAKSGENYAERRKQLIQESKYLGGDMEHTHLVKGLDYALLEKVRAEITSKELEEIDFEEEVVVPQAPVKVEKEEEAVVETQVHFRTKMARNLYRTLFKTKQAERNELFLPGRMAYVVELEDDFGDSDIPTTLIRSKADCPSLESTTTLTTNDIVINKLTQILSYLRQGRRDKKLKKKDKAKLKEEEKPKLTGADEGIYGELGHYVPSYSKGKEKERKEKDRKDRDRDRQDGHRRDRWDRDSHGDKDRHHDRDRDRDRDRHRDRDSRGDRRDREKGYDRDRKRSYFEKPADEDEEKERVPSTAKELVKSINEKFSKGWAPADIEREAALQPGEGARPAKSRDNETYKKLTCKIEINSYAECYPGMMESADAIDDSDDEVDYTKMDQGNKKGPIGRWDFDTQEEYSDYMANKEALPKAAFQYGVKMADGRKTRRTGPKDEKAELDREWQKIQNIIAKRKQMGTEGEPYSKMSKY